MFASGEFNAHQDTLLKHSNVTDETDIENFNFSIAQTFTQIGLGLDFGLGFLQQTWTTGFFLYWFISYFLS